MAHTNKENEIVIKKDWYQSETHVYVNILGKHSSKEDCSITMDSDKVIIRAIFATGQPYTLHLQLFKNIVPDRSTYKLMSSKLEISLAKTESGRWDVLEKAIVQPPANIIGQTRNWDQVVNDMTKDDEDNDVQSLFKKIYSEGNDEVRKAMNKSFLESGGTVLSTNWRDVGHDRVEVKPPEGMEWKKWDE